MRVCMQRSVILLLSTLAISWQVSALTSDRLERLDIQADAAVIDDLKGTSIYRGNVVIEQGTLLINADEIKVITTADRVVIQIIAKTNAGSNKLAHYEQLPDDSEDIVFADAKRIVYLVQEERLHLLGNATLKQTRDVVKGEVIKYDVNRGIMHLGSTTTDGRVKIIINPKEN